STRFLAWFGAWIVVLTVATERYPEQHLYVWTTLGVSSAIVMIVGVHRNRPRRMGPWYLLAGAMLAQAIGDASVDVLVVVYHQDDPYPSIGDVFYLAMYVLIA